MSDAASILRRNLVRLYRADRPLTVVGLLMLLALAASSVGLTVDHRTITGSPAWLKPAKFALSTSMYSLTVAWLFTFLPEWVRTRRLVGWTTAAVFVIEVGIIDVQAWRGTTSHFNVSTPLDAALFSVMGAGILVQTIVSVWLAVALWRQPIANRALGAALRAGVVLTIVGASTGGLMTRPTADQLATAAAGHRLVAAGAHTVGAPDGGPGLPAVGWSAEHGDLRIPHFVGLHAMQLLPALALLLRRRTEASVAVIRAVAGSYAGLFAVLLVQALRGEPLLGPSPLVLAAFGVWIATSAVLLIAATRRPALDGGRPHAALA